MRCPAHPPPRGPARKIKSRVTPWYRRFAPIRPQAREELAELVWWARIDAFDRRAANRALAALSTCPKERSQPDLRQFGTPSWVG
jgi:hypothetical protein